MKIIKVKVVNFRNLSELEVYLDEYSNYIIGENNIGKSNFLSLLDIVCNGRSFGEEDYNDSSKPIEVELKLKLNENELGFFNDCFSPEDVSIVNLLYSQLITDSQPKITSIDTSESIQIKQLRKIHFLKYDSNTIPSKELKIDAKKGVGSLITTIIDKYLEDPTNNQEFLNQSNVQSLVDYINTYLLKIKSFNDYSIKTVFSNEPIEMLTSLFYLSDEERNINMTSSGVQYLSMASINVLCQIMNIYKNKTITFDDHLYFDGDKKILPIVLSIDEPEVHLHPFLQRSLINYYKRILNNQDEKFLELLKMCFDIDGLNGQLIIITHSTDALIDNHKNLIRLCNKRGRVTSICGTKINIKKYEKHLLMKFKEIKEAFYSKCVIFVEGETEYGCMHKFSEKMNVSPDDYGICIINAGGEKSIKPIRKLLDAFEIPSISIYDSDVQNGVTPNEYQFFTSQPCFEVEIVNKLYDSREYNLIKKIVKEIEPNGLNILLDRNYIKAGFDKIGADLDSYTPTKLSSIDKNNRNDYCNIFSSYYISKKGVLLGRIIGELLTKELIPNCYKDAILKAKEVAENGNN